MELTPDFIVCQLYTCCICTVCRFAVRPDDGLDIAETCSCVFMNNKTNISCAGLNLSSFKCKNRNGMSNIKIEYLVMLRGVCRG